MLAQAVRSFHLCMFSFSLIITATAHPPPPATSKKVKLKQQILVQITQKCHCWIQCWNCITGLEMESYTAYFR